MFILFFSKINQESLFIGGHSPLATPTSHASLPQRAAAFAVVPNFSTDGHATLSVYGQAAPQLATFVFPLAHVQQDGCKNQPCPP